MRRWFGWLGLALIIWFLDANGYMLWLKRPVFKLIEPLQKKSYQLGIKEELKEADRLRAELAIREAELVETKEENQQLRTLMGAPLPADWRMVPADVVEVKDNLAKVAVGSKGGAVVGQTVMAYVKDKINNGVLIGRLETKTDFYSTVLLLGSENLQIKAKTGSGAEGVVRTIDGEIYLDKVLQKYKLQKNDLVVSKGGDGFLAGLAIGRVRDIVKQETAVFQKAKLDLILPVTKLTRVWLLSD